MVETDPRIVCQSVLGSYFAPPYRRPFPGIIQPIGRMEQTGVGIESVWNVAFQIRLLLSIVKPAAYSLHNPIGFR